MDKTVRMMINTTIIDIVTIAVAMIVVLVKMTITIINRFQNVEMLQAGSNNRIWRSPSKYK